MLAKSKLNSIETLISLALIDLEITHNSNCKRKKKCDKMSENIKNIPYFL